MHHRVLFLAILLAGSLAASAQEFGAMRGSLSGSVRTADNRPAKDVRVELLANNGQTIADTYTSANGTFDITNIEPGIYEVVATAGLSQVRERVEVMGISHVQMQLPSQGDREAGNRNTVSVAQMQVPGKARDAYKKAQKAMEKQKLEDARRYVDEALSVHPEYGEALTLRGILKLDAKDTEGARKDFEQAIAADSGYAMSYIALGAAYNMLARYDEALRTIDRGLAIAPRAWQGYFELGKAFLGKGSYDAALRQLYKAEDLAPKDYTPIYLVKAHALLGMKNYSEAMAQLQLYLDKTPEGSGNSVHARETLEKVRTFVASQK